MKLIYQILVFILFGFSLLGIILYARGYRLDLKNRSVTSTGILAISAYPRAAKVYINQELKGVTDLNISLPPHQYRIEIKKEGYTTWTKTVGLQGELVITLDALLFPVNPSLSPLTNLGVTKAIAIGQTEKIIVFSENNDELKDGIYLFEPTKKPLSLFSSLKLLLLKKDMPQSVTFKSVGVDFSSDYKEAIFTFTPSSGGKTVSYLLSLEDQNKNLFDITKSKDTLIQAWKKEKEKIQVKILETFPKEFVKIASDSFRIIEFSPDEKRVLYQTEKSITLPAMRLSPLISTNQTKEERTLQTNSFYVYDKEEDKNFKILNAADSAMWYPDSKHLIFIEFSPSVKNNKKTSIIDYDGENKQTVYSGPFENTFFTITTDGKLIILSNLNPESNNLPDLYLVGIQ